jgi:hypothetical protein
MLAQIPFGREAFLGVFREYHLDVGPAPILLAALALIACSLALRPRGASDRLIAAFLAALWTWSGVVYLWLHLTAINPLAPWFAGAFVLQGVLFLLYGVLTNRLRFGARPDAFGATGGTIIAYALVAYPLIGMALGHTYPSAPTFGVPCPTTLFTFGLLLWTVGRVPFTLLLVPLLWSLLAVSAAVNWGVWEDLAMPLVALISCGMLLRRNLASEQRVEVEVKTPAAGVHDAARQIDTEQSIHDRGAHAGAGGRR